MDTQDAFFGDKKIHDKAYVRKEASVIGAVIVEKDVMIAPSVSIRADECGPFLIGVGTNVQDGVIMHGLLNKYITVGTEQFSIWIGSHCSIAHRAIIHGPSKIDKKTFVGFDAIVHASIVGRNCFVDFKAVIKNSTIGNDCHVGVGAIVTNVTVDNGRYIADGQIVNTQLVADTLPMTPASVREKDEEFNHEVVDLNIQLVRLYRARQRKKEEDAKKEKKKIEKK